MENYVMSGYFYVIDSIFYVMMLKNYVIALRNYVINKPGKLRDQVNRLLMLFPSVFILNSKL
jgi:hypothetical protein